MEPLEGLGLSSDGIVALANGYTEQFDFSALALCSRP